MHNFACSYRSPFRTLPLRHFGFRKTLTTVVTAAMGKHARLSPTARKSLFREHPQTLTMHAAASDGEYRHWYFAKCETAIAWRCC